MRLLVFGLSAFLLIAADSSAAGRMCTKHRDCCQRIGSAALVDSDSLPVFPPGSEWQDSAERPVREYARVQFRDPVKVGDKILFGEYVIEHDNDRMAKGGPCTHIYKFDDRQLPVVAFHCVHLQRALTEHATVRLRRLPDPSTKMYELVDFQFENDGDAHGVPGVR